MRGRARRREGGVVPEIRTGGTWEGGGVAGLLVRASSARLGRSGEAILTRREWHPPSAWIDR